MKEIDVIKEVKLPTQLGVIIARMGWYNHRPYPETVLVRTGSDGWREIGESGYKNNNYVIANIIRGGDWVVIYDPAD